MTTVTIDQILQIQVLAIKHSGGSGGVRDMGRLDAAIAAQTQEVFGQELYPTICDKAAAMIRGIICDHPFHDGNKRTAMLVGLTFLAVNGASFEAARGEIENFAVRVAVDRLDVEDIASWLRAHSGAL